MYTKSRPLRLYATVFEATDHHHALTASKRATHAPACAIVVRLVYRQHTKTAHHPEHHGYEPSAVQYLLCVCANANLVT
jgi:hypothetical protein